MKGVSGLRPISIGNSSAVALQDSVVAIGNAGGTGGTPSVVTGIVEAVNQTITASDSNGANPETLHGLIRTTAPIQPGDSGGALVNSSRTGHRHQHRGFCQPSVLVRYLGRVRHPDLHRSERRPPDRVRQGDLEGAHRSAGLHGRRHRAGPAGASATGAVVTGVEPGSPAADAGLEAGDTITAIDGHTVDTPDALSTLTKSHRGGDKITVAWTGQDGDQHSAKVTLIEGPAD